MLCFVRAWRLVKLIKCHGFVSRLRHEQLDARGAAESCEGGLFSGSLSSGGSPANSSLGAERYSSEPNTRSNRHQGSENLDLVYFSLNKSSIDLSGPQF